MKYIYKKQTFIFFILLPILHACNNDDDKMEQTLKISGVVMNEKDEPVQNGKVTFIAVAEYAHSNECSETFEFDLDENGYFSGEISNECNFNGGVTEMYVQDKAGNYVPGLYEDFDFMYTFVKGWMLSSQNVRNIYTIIPSGAENFNQSGWDYGMNSPNSKFYPLQFAYYTNSVNIRISDIEKYENEDTLYIITSPTYWDYLSGEAIFEEGKNNIIKVHPFTSGSEVNVPFKISSYSFTYAQTIAAYENSKAYFYITCDQQLIQALDENYLEYSSEQFDEQEENNDFDITKYDFHLVDFNKHKVGTTNEMSFELTNKCGSLIEMQEN